MFQLNLPGGHVPLNYFGAAWSGYVFVVAVGAYMDSDYKNVVKI